MLNEIKKDAQTRMAKSVEALRHDLTKVRTGRASTALVDHLKVNYYGSDMPLTQVASVAVNDARSLTITPWEKPMVSAVEFAHLAVQCVEEQLHQRADLVLRPAPVLAGEGEQGQGANAALKAEVDAGVDRACAGTVADGARATATLRPAPVAVHDDGDMARDAGLGARGRRR